MTDRVEVPASSVDGSQRHLVEQRLGRTVLDRRATLERIRAGTEHTSGFGAARLGVSEKHVLYRPLMEERAVEARQMVVYDHRARWHAETRSGIYPYEAEFLHEFVDFFAASIQQLDVLGLVFDPVIDPAIAGHFRWEPDVTYYKDLEPDMSCPAQPENCYLPVFVGRRILVVGPFADLLARRAEQDLFERVWRATGRKWFAPAWVRGLRIPYAIAASTREQFPTVLNLYDDITRRMDEIDYDVALVGAGGLSAPLVAHASATGHLALHFGGKLQVLFGVAGGRWRGRPEWDHIVNDDWIDLPPTERPPEAGHRNESYW